jgi:hypothetical protein
MCVPHGVGFGAPRPTAQVDRRLLGLSPPFANSAVQHDGRRRWPAVGGAQNAAERVRSIPSNDDELEEAPHALTWEHEGRALSAKRARMLRRHDQTAGLKQDGRRSAHGGQRHGGNLGETFYAQG